MSNKKTLEEVEKLAFKKIKELGLKGTIDGFNCGYKLAQEQKKKMYTEEEVIQIQKEWRNFDDTQDSFNGQDDLTFREWFEQFKK